MASNTPNLDLYKKDPIADASDTFNITTMLNENWDKIDEGVGELDDTVASHTSNKSNPHGVTKSQVGLGSVQNYGIATQEEAEAGSSTTKYMTPQRTKQAVDKFAPVKSVAGKTGNVTLTGTDIPQATTSARGSVQLNDTLTSTSTTQALTANQGKVLKDLVDGKASSTDLAMLDTKVDEHLAEDATDAHNATNISLIDTSNLFTSTNVEGALNELFTNVSNGKNLVGRAITDVDENITIPTDPTFQQLANAIGQISTGKKWASGQAVISQDKLPFMYVGTGSKNLRYIEVYGLDFKASNIVVMANGNARGFSVYTELDDYYNYSPTVKTAPYINEAATSAVIYSFRGDAGNANSILGGFRIPIHLLFDEVSVCSWIAYE